MFCTNCGTKLEDNMTTCPKCGKATGLRAVTPARTTPCATRNVARPATAQRAYAANSVRYAPQAYGGAAAATMSRGGVVRPMPNAAPTRAVPTTAASSAGTLTATGIISRIAGVGALACMFLPWLEIPAMAQLAPYASYLHLNVSTQSAYPMYGMGDVTKVLDMLSSSSAYSSLQTCFFVLWAAALVLLVVGLVRSFTGKKSARALIPGAIMATLVALFWFASISFIDGEYARQMAQLVGYRMQFFAIPPAVIGTILTGLACTVFAIADK